MISSAPLTARAPSVPRRGRPALLVQPDLHAAHKGECRALHLHPRAQLGLTPSLTRTAPTASTPSQGWLHAYHRRHPCGLLVGLSPLSSVSQLIGRATCPLCTRLI